MHQARTEARAEAEAAAKERFAVALPHVCAELDKRVRSLLCHSAADCPALACICKEHT